LTKLATAILVLGSLLPMACQPVVVSVGAWTPDASTPDATTPEGPGAYIEAEDGELSGGFTIGSDPAASGEAYIAPPAGVLSDDVPGSALARYTFNAPRAATYIIWGRIHSPDAVTNRFWFQVDGGTWYKWRISVGDIWYWDAFHDNTHYGIPLTFPLTEGAHELVIANCVEGAWLDRLYFTSAGDEPPGNDTPCNPPHSIQVGSDCLPSCGSLAGTACGPTACAGAKLLPAYDCSVCCNPSK
jgi:hypothetical protein